MEKPEELLRSSDNIKLEARAWQTFVQMVRESPRETYTKEQLLGLLLRTLKAEWDNQFVERLEELEKKIQGG